MKKILCLLSICIILFSLTSCGSKDNTSLLPVYNINQITSAQQTVSGYDVDLTQMSSTMVYSEVSNIMNSPDQYEGKSIKMTGIFSVYTDEQTGNEYYSCIIQDATACCSQGMEFVLTQGNYPEEGSEVTVAGTFETYKEDDVLYCHLINAKLV